MTSWVSHRFIGRRLLHRFVGGTSTVYLLPFFIFVLLVIFFLYGNDLFIENINRNINSESWITSSFSNPPTSAFVNFEKVNDIGIHNYELQTTMSTKGPVQFSTTSNDLQFYRSFNKLIGANRFINGKPYPKLTARGKFVPLRHWVHIDMKGAPFKVRQILRKAQLYRLEVVPLVQTFGHLEWILKLDAFSHLREDSRYPQVICIGAQEAWDLLTDMIDQVASVHKEFGMSFFHIGADEVFQTGICNDTIEEMRNRGGRDRLILWHIYRTANHVLSKFNVTVLAWHDMFVQMVVDDLKISGVTEVLEPVIWSYAEDLDSYIAPTVWDSLKPFRNVWCATAFKGADGPMRFSSNPTHYIRNHESWTAIMTRVYKDFKFIQGLIVTGWSRYDHLAILCELFPVGIPTLSMCLETIMNGRPMEGDYHKTRKLLKCAPPYGQGYTYGCHFPGSPVYELVNELAAKRDLLRKYLTTDFDFNGWGSIMTGRYNFSSPMYIERIQYQIDYYLIPLERLELDIRTEMNKIFFKDAVDEFILTYMSQDLKLLRDRKSAANVVLEQRHFQKRPFI